MKRRPQLRNRRIHLRLVLREGFESSNPRIFLSQLLDKIEYECSADDVEIDMEVVAPETESVKTIPDEPLDTNVTDNLTIFLDNLDKEQKSISWDDRVRRRHKKSIGAALSDFFKMLWRETSRLFVWLMFKRYFG